MRAGDTLEQIERMTTMENRLHLDRQYAGLLEDITIHPSFVMGDHRTGTTILYKILGATGCFNITTSYHIIKYNEIVHNYVHKTVDDAREQLRALFDQKGLGDRVIDGMPASPDMPEEYGFILRNTGYRQWLKPDNVADLIDLCKKVQLTSGVTRPLLLKNPWDFFLNFMYVKETFPDSKFIFIHRNPIGTINSQIRAIRSVLSTKNEYVALMAGWYNEIFRRPLRLYAAKLLFSSHFNLGLRITTRHVARATDYFLKHVSLLPREDYVCVRYEDLCQEPRATITKILDALGLKENAGGDYESLIKVRTDSLLSEVERNREYIFRRTKPYFDYGGYTLEDIGA